MNDNYKSTYKPEPVSQEWRDSWLKELEGFDTIEDYAVHCFLTS